MKLLVIGDKPHPPVHSIRECSLWTAGDKKCFVVCECVVKICFAFADCKPQNIGMGLKSMEMFECAHTLRKGNISSARFLEEDKEDVFKSKTKEMEASGKALHWNPFYTIFQMREHWVSERWKGPVEVLVSILDSGVILTQFVSSQTR